MRTAPLNRLGTLRTVFPSSNEWGIPDLRPDMLGRVESAGDVVLCGTMPISHRMSGKVLAFWTDDFRFCGAWTKPVNYASGLVSSGVRAVLEPDFSLYSGDPKVEQLHSVYRMRWCGRYWQERGLEVIPNIAWSDDVPPEMSWSGIPVGCPCIGIEGRPRAKDRVEWVRGASLAIHKIRPQQVLLYGVRPDWQAELPHDVPIVSVAAWSPKRRMAETSP